MDVLRQLFGPGDFMPHGYCYLWNPGLVWLNVISDSLIAVAYFNIPVGLLWVVRKRRDLPFGFVFCAFGDVHRCLRRDPRTLGLLESVIGSNIEIKPNLTTDLALVHADPTQIEQVIMNLCINARDAPCPKVAGWRSKRAKVFGPN